MFKIKAGLLNFLIRKESNQPIRIISEGSCDTEDWSNNTKYSALHHKNKLHKTVILNDNNI